MQWSGISLFKQQKKIESSFELCSFVCPSIRLYERNPKHPWGCYLISYQYDFMTFDMNINEYQLHLFIKSAKKRAGKT
ncbi:hypothetical protein FF38_12448 [Lucilia cuprina]|uniref:Uncharacterized protein n=1 Tax=Lucilia cuprina TaxID=7375 RepID=A0A0L0CKZ0_LUCCU|nr:hypothetical protein FF38_12448 [Lucilia cuprina]